MREKAAVPCLDLDIFCDEVLDDPWDAYRHIRDAGPVVHLERDIYDIYVIGRFQDVTAAARNWNNFSSAKGIAFNDLANDLAASTVVGCDPPLHSQLRKLMTDRLSVTEVRSLTSVVQTKVDDLVAQLVSKGSFDAVKDFAEVLVPGVLGDLLGIHGDLLDAFAAAGHPIGEHLGPLNARAEQVLLPLFEFAQRIGCLGKHEFEPGGMAWKMYEAAERGEIPEDMCNSMLMNYIGPGFHTTIYAIGSAIWLLGRDPEQWERLKGNPELLPSAVNEAVRMESPIQIMSRWCEEDVEVDGVTVPAGSRVGLLFGSANRDERHYPNPDHFDVARDAIDHVGFGSGIHHCLGAPLARAELTATLKALTEQVSTLECDSPIRALSNTTRGLSSVRVSIS